MATDEWLLYGQRELINLSRTAQLAEVLGIDMLWTMPDDVAWIEAATGGIDYGVIEQAPWYDPGFPASAEFAGLVPLSFNGLGDSTREASTIEYITDGGSAGRARNKTLPIVASVAVLASTERGAEFGKAWLDRVLAGSGARQFCSGSDLYFFAYDGEDSDEVPPLLHYRDVSLSRGTSITRKRSNHCSVMLTLTFTLTANDPFMYGIPVTLFQNFGGGSITPVEPHTISSGSVSMIEVPCPVYDYTPIYDPLYPALVAPPTAPDFYPDGWNLPEGREFTRYWTRQSPLHPTSLSLVPQITLTSNVEARMVRVSVWPSTADVDETCEPLWQAIITYMPAVLQFIIDGEQRAPYAWDGGSPRVRRTDSLVYGAGARPLDWTAFNDPSGYLVTLDLMKKGSTVEGDGTLRMEFSLVSKSD